MIYHNHNNLHCVHCGVSPRTYHGEPRTGIEVCGQQYHAVHSWLSQKEKLDARLLYRGSLDVVTAVAVVVLEKRQQPAV